MIYKKFILLFFLLPFLLIGTLFSLNLLIDPFGITDYNILNIKYKMARDDRTEKVERIKKIKQIDNLILGSSRSQHIDSAILTKYFGGYSYNFGVGGGNSADALGLLLYLESKDKLPKNILLTLDFSTFKNDELHPSFYKLPELNFLNKDMKEENQIAKFLSIDAIRASFKTIKAHLKHTVPNSYFNKEGFMVSNKPKTTDAESINKLSISYVNNVYKNGDMKISKARLNNVQSIVNLCKKHNINLTVTLTPVASIQYKLIQKNKKLLNKMQELIVKLATITPFYDAMIDNMYVQDVNNFEDNVHTNEKYAEMYLASIYKREYIELTKLKTSQNQN